MAKKYFCNGALGAWWGLLVGCLLIIGSLRIFTEDDGYIDWRGVYVPIWVDWILLPFGIGIIVYSIYSLITGKEKSEADINAEAAEAEAEMDALYLREYGELPEKPKPEIIESKTFESETGELEKPKKATE